MTVDRQLEELRKMARRKVSIWLTVSFTLVAAGLLVCGVVKGQWLYFLFAGAAAVLAFSTHQTTPHIDAAARALEEGAEHKCSVHVEVERGSDSDTFAVLIFLPNAVGWRYDFVPIGWKPEEGVYQAAVYSLVEVSWPVLVRFDDGIAIPRSKPVLQPL
jgi:hypothetical protein